MTLPKPYYEDTKAGITIYHADNRDILPLIPDKSVDLVLTDPPYGIGSQEWDIPVDLQLFWDNCKNQSSPFIIFSSQPFTSELILSKKYWFKHEWVWARNIPLSSFNGKESPLKSHENILVFCNGKYIFNPQYEERENAEKQFSKNRKKILGDRIYYKNPKSVLNIKAIQWNYLLHPAQKPIELIEYLLRTYSNGANLILDPFLGSGTTAYCAKKLGRKCIGIEIEEKYCEIAAKRLSQEVMAL